LGAYFSAILLASSLLGRQAFSAEPSPAPSPSAAQRAVKRYTIEQFMDTVRVGGAAFSHDEKTILFHSNKTGIFNVYDVPVAGGASHQLTNSNKESVYVLAAFPADKRFLYTYDKGGNENSHIYIRELDGRERDFTPGDKVKANFLGWRYDRKAFFFSTNARNEKFFDVYQAALPDLTPRLLFQDDVGLQYADISRNGRFIAFTKPGKSTSDSDVYICNTENKEVKNITPHEGSEQNSAQVFDLSSRYLLFLSDAGEEFTYIARYDLSKAERSEVQKESRDITSVSFSHNGKYRVVTANEDARTKVTVYDAASNQPVNLPALPDGDITGVTISDSEKKLAFYHNGSRSPNDLYVYDFDGGKTVRLTNSLGPQINPADLAEGKVVRYKSFDGLEIPAILYRPLGLPEGAKAPAIVHVHGGPGGQARLNYSASMQFLVNHGYVIIDVNNRGSSGYGKTFFAADDRKHGREPLWDCVEAKKFLSSLGYVDDAKIGIMGDAYGGYMVLAALAFKPEEFAVGVDMFGISNWIRTLRSIPAYWESERRSLYAEIGDPVTQENMLREISPLFHAENITKPLMVLQGANDPRVLKSESDEIVDAVKKKGGVAEYLVFPDEGHGFSKKANEIRAYQAVLEFLDKYLRGSESK
jgi:dipeptidyl aminopeptidase/acylaminoacyl peptidase